MALKNFDQIVEQAKSVQKPKTVVIAGADAENILLGAFMTVFWISLLSARTPSIFAIWTSRHLRRLFPCCSMVLFPPGAAQRSSTRSPGRGDSTATAAMALGS